MITVEKPGTPTELVHFGVKGMHWGVRKREESTSAQKPRPQLSEKKEKRALKHESNAKNMQAAIDQIHANPSRWAYAQKQRADLVKDLEKRRNRELNDAKAVREGRLTSKQKKILIGTGVTVGLLAAYGTYKLADSGQINQFRIKDIPLNKNDLLSRKMSTDQLMHEVVKPINPNYGELGTKMNCRRATFAYEMRRRGYDVKSTKSISGTGQTVAGLLNATDPESHLGTGRLGMTTRLLQEGKKGGPLTAAVNTAHGLGRNRIGAEGEMLLRNPGEKSKLVFDSLSKYPEGARGELGLQWSMGGAHSMVWEIVGGKPVVFDAQSGIAHGVESFAENVAPALTGAGTTRLDHLELNTGYLRRWVRNVK